MKKLFVFIVVAVMSLAVVSNSFALMIHRNNCAHNVIGDINDDGETTIADVSIFSIAYQSRYGDARFNRAADLTCDNIIDDNDVLILSAGMQLYYNTSK